MPLSLYLFEYRKVYLKGKHKTYIFTPLRIATNLHILFKILMFDIEYKLFL